MKKIVVGSSIVGALVLGTLLTPPSAAAFSLFNFAKGQVLGETTQQTGVVGTIKRFSQIFNGNSQSGQSGENGQGDSQTESSGALEMQDPTPRLNAAVKAGKITEAQKTEILKQFNAIKAKRKELTTLEKAFADWLKANKLSTEFLGSRPPQSASGAAGLRKIQPQVRTQQNKLEQYSEK